MALSGKYGRVNIPQIGEDEPVFILRAQDMLAISAIEIYRSLAESHGAPVVETLQREINSFRAWDGQKKVPD